MADAKHISDSDRIALDASDFWSRVSRGTDNECWPWTGTLTDNGYGRFVSPRGEHRAHRIAYALGYSTPVPSVVMICHRCDNRRCCNPRHLFIGAAADNNADARAKGRHVAPSGLANGKAKLSDAQVIEIAGSTERGSVLAARYGVSASLVSMIRKGTRRRMVGDAGVEPATFRV